MRAREWVAIAVVIWILVLLAWGTYDTHKAVKSKPWIEERKNAKSDQEH